MDSETARALGIMYVIIGGALVLLTPGGLAFIALGVYFLVLSSEAN